MAETNQLLMEIQKVLGYTYLSDLHAGCRLLDKRKFTLIKDIPSTRYPLEAWREAISYITGKKCEIVSVEEAKENLLNIMI